MGGIVPDKSVDLDAVNIVELLQAGLDLGLVGADVDNEDQSVVLLLTRQQLRLEPPTPHL